MAEETPAPTEASDLAKMAAEYALDEAQLDAAAAQDGEAFDETATEDSKGTAKTAAKTEKISDSLAQRARDLGLSDAEIGEHDEASLRRTVTAAERVADRVLASQWRQPQQAQQQQQQQTPPKERKKIDREKLAPELADVLEQYEQDLTELRDVNQKLIGAVRHIGAQDLERARNEFTTRMDSYIAKAAGYEHVLGKGTLEDVVAEHGENSAFLRARQAIAENISALANHLHAQGSRVPSERELFARAVRMLHGDPKTESKPDVQERVQEIIRNGREAGKASPGRPSQKPQRAEPKGEVSAVRAVQAVLDRRGLPGGRTHSESNEELN